MQFIQSESVKRLIIDMLKKLASMTDNTVDDEAVKMIERGLFGWAYSDPWGSNARTSPDTYTDVGAT